MKHTIHQASAPVDRPDLRFGDKAHPILRELQHRIDTLPKGCLNFVAALMAGGTLVEQPLSDLVFGMVYIRNGISIEPIHQALATLVALRHEKEASKVKLRDEKMAFILVCGADKAADNALKFVVELQTLNILA
jgi:hypothetical protein